MPVAYLYNGKAPIRDGKPVLGDCCCPGIAAEMEFYYRFVKDSGAVVTPPSPVYGTVLGRHTITVSVENPNVAVSSSVEYWDEANWPVDQNWTSLGCDALDPSVCNLARRNGQARIDIRLSRFQTVHLAVNDSRTFSSPEWGVDPKVYVQVYLRITRLGAGQKIRLYYSNNVYVELEQTGNWLVNTRTDLPKTNSRIAYDSFRIELR